MLDKLLLYFEYSYYIILIMPHQNSRLITGVCDRLMPVAYSQYDRLPTRKFSGEQFSRYIY